MSTHVAVARVSSRAMAPRHSEQFHMVMTPDQRAALDAASRLLMQPLSVVVRACLAFGLEHLDEAMEAERARRTQAG